MRFGQVKKKKKSMPKPKLVKCMHDGTRDPARLPKLTLSLQALQLMMMMQEMMAVIKVAMIMLVVVVVVVMVVVREIIPMTDGPDNPH